MATMPSGRIACCDPISASSSSGIVRALDDGNLHADCPLAASNLEADLFAHTRACTH